MHPEHYTDLDNLDTVENNFRHSAKGSNDAYDVPISLTPISSVSTDQWHQDRSGEPDVLMGQSIVLGEIKAEVPLHDENPLNDQIIWQQYIQQVESLSPENKVSKF